MKYRHEEPKMDGFSGGWMYVLPTESFADYIDHPLIRRMYLTDAGYFPHAAHHYRERKEGIEEYIYIYCAAGSGVIELFGRNQTVTLHANEAFCIPRYCGHRYYACPEDPWTIFWVHFKGTDTEQFPLETCLPVAPSTEDSQSRLSYLFELLPGALGGDYTLGNFIYLSQVLMLILSETYCRESSAEVRAQNRQVTEIVRFMYRNIRRELTLEELTHEFGLSKSYLHALFSRHTGHSPMNFFIRLKMKEACTLLRSNLCVYEVALTLGYRDPFYFSRCFKKVVGVSPKEYKAGANVS